jgi:seryl-tRNA synthetase
LKKTNREPTRGREIKEEIRLISANVADLAEQLHVAVDTIPNFSSTHTPIGGEEAAVVLHQSGNTMAENDHVEILERFNWADFPSGAKASGEGFVYLKNELCLLELGLIQFAMERVSFIIIIIVIIFFFLPVGGCSRV